MALAAGRQIGGRRPAVKRPRSVGWLPSSWSTPSGAVVTRCAADPLAPGQRENTFENAALQCWARRCLLIALLPTDPRPSQRGDRQLVREADINLPVPPHPFALPQRRLPIAFRPGLPIANARFTRAGRRRPGERGDSTLCMCPWLARTG